MLEFGVTIKNGVILCIAFLFTICHGCATWGYIYISQVSRGGRAKLIGELTWADYKESESRDWE